MLLLAFAKNLQAQSPIIQSPVYACDDSAGTTSCIHACIGDTISYSLSDNGAVLNSWGFPTGVDLVSGANTSQVFVVWNTPGQYFITASITGSDGYPKNLEQCVIVTGVTAAISSNYTFTNGNCINICRGSPVTFNNNSYSNIVSSEWDFGDGTPGAQAIGVASVIHEYNVAGTYTVVLTVNSDCCSDTAQYCVIVDPSAGPEISCITAVCAGQQGVMYSGQSCTNYEWEVTGGTISGSTSSNPVSVDWGNGPEGTVSLLCNDPGACSVPTIVSIPIMPAGNFVISGQQNVCASCPATYSYSAPYIPGAQYQWELDGFPLQNSTQPYIQNIPFCSGSHTLTCHMENDVLDCVGDATLTINVIGDFEISGTDSLCVNTQGIWNANLIPNGPGLICDWEIKDANGNIVGSIAMTNSPGYQFTLPGTYTVTATPNPLSSACSPSKSLTVVVIAVPVVSLINGPAIVCPGGIYSYSAFVSSPTATINWALNEGVNFPTGNGTTFTGIFPAGFTSGTLTATVSEGGCSSSTSININAPAQPQPVIIQPDTFQVCIGQSITYAATLSYPGLSTVQWVISPTSAGTITSGQGTNTVTVLWNGVGGNVTLEVNETTCLTQTGSNVIPITYFATPIITATTVSVCTGVAGILSATGGLSHYQWFYPTGLPVSGATNSTYSTSVPGNYFVTGTDVNGCKANAYTQATQLTEPIVSVFGPASAPCDPLSATGDFIDPQTLQTFDGNGYTFAWSNGMQTNPIIVTQTGTYTVTVTNAAGCTKTESFTIGCQCPIPECPACVNGGTCTNGVFDNPPILTAPTGTSYMWSPNGETTQTITASVPGISYIVTVFDNANMNCPSSVYSYYVFCDGDVCPFEGGNTTCTANAPSFTQAGSDCNTISFQANTTGACNTISGWSFGDGTSGTGNTPTHTYSMPGAYQVCYGITPTFVCEDPISACDMVSIPVAADFSFVVNCNVVTFTDLSNTLPGFNITGWSWNFGDNTPPVTAQSPTHTYNGGGPYYVTLTIQAGDCQAKITHTVLIQAPNVSINLLPALCNAPVQLSATINSGSTNIVDWSWNFNDPGISISNLQNPVHTFPAGGPYNVNLTVTDGFGCTATANMDVTALAPPLPFPLTGGTACGSLIVMTPNSGSYSSFQWSNNGTELQLETQSQILVSSSGNYSVEVTDANGCIIVSTPAQVVINPLPPINLSVSPNPVCSNDILTLHSGVSSTYTVEWFDINQVSQFLGVNYQLPLLGAGIYRYICEVTDQTTGCKSIDTITFTVGASPIIISIYNTPAICAPEYVSILANAFPTVNYLWSNGATTPSINVYTSGTYTLTVTEPTNGCTASASATATIFPLPDLTMLPIGCDSSCINPTPETIHGPDAPIGESYTYTWIVNNLWVNNSQDLTIDGTQTLGYGVPIPIKLIVTTINGCIDSIEFEYTPLDCDSIESHCYTTKDTIWCNTDGTYSFQLQVQNNNATASASIKLYDFTAPFLVQAVMDPPPNPQVYQYTPLYYQFLNIPAGGTSAWFPTMPIILSVPPNNQVPVSFCFKSLIIYGDTCCYDSLCIEIPNCDPCENISASSTDADSSCCKTVSLYNNFNGSYFTGIQVTPVTPGATIGSTYLGGAYAGTWNSPTNNTATVIYEPNLSNNGGFIPTGTTTDLFTMCLSLAPGTPSPQIVLLDWLVPNAAGTADSVACTDTLKFYCESEPKNLCGTVEDTITCLGNGSYQYSFTLTNNSMNAINTAAVDAISPTGWLIGFPSLFYFSPALAPGASYTHTFTFSTALPAGSEICYHITLLDSIGCCCHDVDTVCFTLPACDSTLITCGERTTYGAVVDNSGNIDYGVLLECGDVLDPYINTLPATISFVGGGYVCSDGNPSGFVSWSLPGATPSSGSGYPVFTISTPGSYVLTIYSLCDGKTLCDSCELFINIPATDTCNCGSWSPLSVDMIAPDGAITSHPDQSCGAVFNDVAVGTMVNFSAGGYLCSPSNESCVATLFWSMPGATPSSGSGLPIFTINNPGSYTLTLQGACGVNTCEICQFTFNVVDEADTCTCGNWDFLLAQSVNPDGTTSFNPIMCGDNLTGIEPGATTTIMANYLCNTNDCAPTFFWVVNGPSTTEVGTSGFPSDIHMDEPGTYTFTITPTCGGNECSPCVFTITVGTDEEECNCGYWTNHDIVLDEPATDVPIILTNQSCGAIFNDIPAGTTVNFSSGGYLCSPSNESCVAALSWSMPGATPSSGSGLPSFTLNNPGTYTLTMQGTCGVNTCEQCDYTFNVDSALVACACGTWSPFDITTSSSTFTNQQCGASYFSKKGQPISINGMYNCLGGGGTCAATYSWAVKINGTYVLGGSTLPINFTPLSSGSCTVTISGLCNGTLCEACSFNFHIISQPAPPDGLSVLNTGSVNNVELMAAPNPAQDVVTLRLSSANPESGMIVWYDDLGIARKQTFTQWDGSEIEIEMNVSDLAGGIYFVHFNGIAGSGFTKVIVYR